MPNPTPFHKVVPFETMLDQLSKQLEFKSREKLGLFVRSIVEKIVGSFLKGSRQNMAPDQVKYRVLGSSRFEVNAELDILAKNGRGLKGLCSLGLKQNAYRGIPDGSPTLTNPKELPLLVKRHRILIKDIKPREGAIWFGRNYLKNKVKQCEDSDLVIDVQTE